MHLLKTLALAFLTANASSAFAQIEKGNYSLGGEVGLSGNFQRSEFHQSAKGEALISPSIGEFIADKWFLSVRPTVRLDVSEYRFKNPNGTFMQDNLTTHVEALGLDVGTRYYFATLKNAHFFGLASVAFSKSWNTYNDANGGPFTFGTRSFTYELGLGTNVFFNPEVAFEARLSYRQINLYSDGFSFPQPANGSNFGLWNLNLQFNNFIDFSAKKEKEEDPQYVKKGRQILGGQASLLSYRFDGITRTIYNFAPEFSQFVTNNILLKGHFSLQGDIDDGNNKGTNTSLEVRYYVPISKRFFIYPRLNASFLTGNSAYLPDISFSDASPYKWLTGLGLGSSYFLSKNVAVDASLFQANAYSGNEVMPRFAGLLGVGNVSLLYFIR